VGGSDYTALGDTVNAAFRLEAATKEIGLGVALGQRTYDELKMAADTPFSRRQVSLKGYESPTTTWAISFDELQRYLKEREAETPLTRL
jgi:adenylate cyclase